MFQVPIGIKMLAVHMWPVLVFLNEESIYKREYIQVVKVGNVAPLLAEQPDIDELVSIESDINFS